MIHKLSEYRTALNFRGRSARNFSDWLRADRETLPVRIDEEIAYNAEFVRDSLRKRIKTIEKNYPEAFPNVSEFINGITLENINHEPKQTEPETDTEPETEPKPEPDEQTNIVSSGIDGAKELEEETKPDHSSDETVSQPDRVPDTPTRSKLRQYLTNPETMLWGTVAVIFVFLPFTVLNLYQYISIETNTAAGEWGVFLLCCGIAFVWDISILLFAVNGKHQMSKIGAGVLFVFMAAKFDFFKRIVDLFGADGEWWQLMFVLSAIVFYSPILIHQYTKLSVKHEPK